jgi:2-alkenal reductase
MQTIPSSPRSPRHPGLLAAVGVALLLVVAFILGSRSPWLTAQSPTPTIAFVNAPAVTSAPAPARTGEPSQQSAAAPLADPVAVVAQVNPAVVTVINEQQARGFDASGQLVPVGSGTGFIIDTQGHIVTNWHVVDGGQQFQVVFADGTTRPAQLIGSDQVSDLAVVQVGGDLPGAVALGDSDALKPGQSVLAIGSPLGSFTNTVTEGIVSALGRNLPDSFYTNLIQHDAPINPGNSGGPLLDLAGEVVGVNTLGINVENGQPVQGLFFAIPSNTVKTIAAQLIASGQVAYPYLGITPVPVTQAVAAQTNLAVDYGAYVASVAGDGPAAEAGIQEGDVILAIDAQRIDQQHPFSEVLFARKPGETVTIDLQRGSQQLSVQVTLTERPAQPR